MNKTGRTTIFFVTLSLFTPKTARADIFDDIQAGLGRITVDVFTASIASLIMASLFFNKGENDDAAIVEQFDASSFKDQFIAGDIPKEVKLFIDCVSDSDRFEDIGIQVPKGLLLVGPPGNGKTTIARYIAQQTEAPLLAISAPDFFLSPYVGRGSKAVKKLFSLAHLRAKTTKKPVLIFIDELDSVGEKRAGIDGPNKMKADTLNTLLVELDGIDKRDNIFIIGATNRYEQLDSALLRPGRFDYHVTIAHPDFDNRKKILEFYRSKVAVDPLIDWDDIAYRTAGFTVAELEGLIKKSIFQACGNDKECITMEELEEQMVIIAAGGMSSSTTIKSNIDERTITAYHEAGHIVVGVLTEEYPYSVASGTIIPHGLSLGSTRPLFDEHKHSFNKKELEAEIMMALGGLVGEVVMTGESTTGVGSDFKKAQSIAYNLVVMYGMSDLGIMPEPSSEEAKAKVDNEVKAIITRCYEQTKALLENHKEELARIAQALLDKGTLHKKEIYELLGRSVKIESNNFKVNGAL